MASIYKEFIVNSPVAYVWDAVKDVGAVHTHLAKGFVTDTVLEGNVRTVAFANGVVVRETIISVDEKKYRLAYTASGGRATHHNAYIQVFRINENQSKVVWVTDLLPDEACAPIAQMVDLGSEAIKQTLESAYRASSAVGLG